MALVFVLLCGLQAANGQKLKTEEIIAKHLEAIGGTETLAVGNESRRRRNCRGDFQGTGNGPTRRTRRARIGRPKEHGSDGF